MARRSQSARPYTAGSKKRGGSSKKKRRRKKSTKKWKCELMTRTKGHLLPATREQATTLAFLGCDECAEYLKPFVAMDKAVAELEEERARTQSKEDTRAALASENAQLEAKIRELEREVVERDRIEAGLRDELEDAMREGREKGARITKIKDELRTTARELSAIKEEHQTQHEELMDRLDELAGVRQERNELRSALETEQKTRLFAQQQLATAQKRVNNAEADIRTLELGLQESLETIEELMANPYNDEFKYEFAMIKRPVLCAECGEETRPVAWRRDTPSPPPSSHAQVRLK